MPTSVIDRITIEAGLMVSGMGLAVFWIIGNLLGIVALTKVGVPVTMFLIVVSVVVAWKFAVNMGGPTAKVVGPASLAFGFLAMVVIMVVAMVFPYAFPDLYSLVEMKTGAMSMFGMTP
jgi:hypothetical protein